VTRLRKITITGRTVEEILTVFEEDYEIKKDEYTYEVIDKGSTGFLGMFARDAVLEIKIKKDYFERKLQEFIENIVLYFDPQIVVKVHSRNPRNFVAKIEGDGIGKIIGKHGKGLGALQHLATIFLNRLSDTKISVILDAGDYREKRKESIKKIVNIALEKLKENGTKKIELDPMFSFERRIVHEILKKHKWVHSYSVGIEPYRYVVIERRDNNENINSRKDRSYNN